jgi:hypothetical protein
MLSAFLLLSVAVAAALAAPAPPTMLEPKIEAPSGFTALRHSNNSTLYRVNVPKSASAGGRAGATGSGNYTENPYLVTLRGTRHDVGYDYAALLHTESAYTLNAFLNAVFPKKEDQTLLLLFIDYCW